MLKMPVKILSDPDREPFIPFVTVDGVFINGTDLTAKDYFEDRYTKGEVDDMFKALGTVMDFRGVVENETQLPELAEPGDVYLVLHYEESTVTHGVIWQDGKGWVDMGTPVDLDDYYIKSEVDDIVSNSIKEYDAYNREETNSAVSTALRNAKSYTDNSIYDLHMDQYLNGEQVREEIFNSHVIPHYVGTPDEPIILTQLFDNSLIGTMYYAILEGNVKYSEESNDVYILEFALYNVVAYNDDAYQLYHFYLKNTTPTYKRIIIRPSFHAFDDYRLITTVDSLDITEPWRFTSRLKSDYYATSDNDVVNKKYLDDMVVEPMMKLIRRLNGEDVN